MAAGTPVGVVGLGQMGGALAQSLVRGGFATYGFDVAADRVRLFEREGGQSVGSPAAVAEACELVITSLPSVAALDAVVNGVDGLAAAGRAGLVVMEASTLPIDAKERAWAALGSVGAVLLDCPVSGTAAQARKGDLAVFASGDRAAIDRFVPVFEAVSRTWRYVGEFGVGMKLKFVANLLIAVHNLAAGEALVLGMKAGLDPQLVYDVISESAATSRMFEVSGPLMVRRDYDDASAKVSILHKDLQLIREFATAVQAPTPLGSVTAEYYTSAMALGLESKEDASVALLLERLAGLEDRIVP
jgi:3-hydroxyisobutyrate dehydrogenase-like beta-hydroxyacid dehydrogenase